MSALGQTRPFRPSQPNVRFAPIADIPACWSERGYGPVKLSMAQQPTLSNDSSNSRLSSQVTCSAATESIKVTVAPE